MGSNRACRSGSEKGEKEGQDIDERKRRELFDVRKRGKGSGGEKTARFLPICIPPAKKKCMVESECVVAAEGEKKEKGKALV